MRKKSSYAGLGHLPSSVRLVCAAVEGILRRPRSPVPSWPIARLIDSGPAGRIPRRCGSASIRVMVNRTGGSASALGRRLSTRSRNQVPQR